MKKLFTILFVFCIISLFCNFAGLARESERIDSEFKQWIGDFPEETISSEISFEEWAEFIEVSIETLLIEIEEIKERLEILEREVK